MPEMSKRKKVTLGCLGLFLLVFIPAAIFYGPALVDLYPEIREVTKDPEQRQYQGTTRDNLKAIHTAIMQFHDSEERFPDPAKWMDEMENYLETADLAEGEAAKKLINPAVAKSVGEYGFAMNKALGNKYKGDIKDPKTILIFESKDTKRNASGDPTALKPDGGGEGITISGDLVPIP